MDAASDTEFHLKLTVQASGLLLKKPNVVF
jgi:hypothetical protein